MITPRFIQGVINHSKAVFPRFCLRWSKECLCWHVHGYVNMRSRETMQV